MTYSSVVLADTPVTYWRLGEASGTNAADASGNGNDGTYNGSPTLGQPGLLAGDSDTAVTFTSASNQYVKANADSTGTYGAYSLEVAFVLTVNPGSGSYAHLWGVDATDGGLMALEVAGGSPMQLIWYTSFGTPQFPVSLNTVYHVIGTFDGSVGILYLNGTEVARQAAGGSLTLTSSDFFFAGSDDFDDLVDGTLDECSFYDYALSAGQVIAHYNASLGGNVSSSQVLASLSDSANTPYVEVTWSERADNQVGVNVQTIGGYIHHYASLVIADNNWHSYAVALDSTNAMGVLYLDGRTGVAFPIDSVTWPAAGGRWFLGGKTDGTGFFAGNLDEFDVANMVFDETTAYQVTTHATQGTTLSVTGSGGNAVVRPFATVVTVASLVAQKRNVIIQLTTSTLPGQGAALTVSTNGSLTVNIPTAPPSVPQTWVATTTASAAATNTTLAVSPLTVAIPSGGILYFPNGVSVQVDMAANVRDTILSIVPLVGTIASGSTGTGINPAAYTVTSSASASTSATSITIAANPQYMAAGSVLYFTSTPSAPVTLTANAAFGATSISVSSLANAIPSGTTASGTPIPPGSGDPNPPGPGTGTAPPPGPGVSPFVPLKRYSLRYPEATLDANGFPI